MKHAYLVYFPDRSGKVVIAEDLSEVQRILSEDDLKRAVKIELVPFEVV